MEVVFVIVEYGIAVLPHVESDALEFLDEGHCPSEAGLLYVQRTVRTVLDFFKVQCVSSQYEVVPAQFILCGEGFGVELVLAVLHLSRIVSVRGLDATDDGFAEAGFCVLLFKPGVQFRNG